MALKRVSPLSSFSSVAASSTASIDLPVGPRYHVIWLVYDNAAHDGWLDANVCSDIRLKVNGKVQRTFSAAELNALNALMNNPSATYGTAADVPYSTYDNTGAEAWLPIFLAEPWRPEIVSKEGLAWGTGDLQSFQIEVDLGSATGPVLRAYAEVDNAVVTTEGLQRAMPMGNIVKWSRFYVPYTAAGILNLQTIPRRDVILQLSLWNTATAYISSLQVKADNYEWRDLSEQDNGMILRARGMNPTAVGGGATTRYDVVFDYDDFPPGAGLRADAIRDLQFNLTVAQVSGQTLTAGSFTAMLQTLGRPD